MTSLRKTLFTSLVALLSIGLAPAIASADIQEYDKGTDRDGFVIGLGAGLGHMQCQSDIGCDGVTEAGGVNLQLGLMASSRLALITDLWAMGHTNNDLTLTQGIASVGPQFWVMDRLWLRAGVGIARSGWRYDAEILDIDIGVSDQTDYVPAATGALGFEIVSTDDFALDAQLRAGAGFMYDDAADRIQNYSLGIGATWY